MTRSASITRQTNETKINVSVALDGSGNADLHSGVGFLDHMIEQIAHHGLIDISLECRGELHVDSHHTVEGCGIALIFSSSVNWSIINSTTGD